MPEDPRPGKVSEISNNGQVAGGFFRASSPRTARDPDLAHFAAAPGQAAASSEVRQGLVVTSGTGRHVKALAPGSLGRCRNGRCGDGPETGAISSRRRPRARAGACLAGPGVAATKRAQNGRTVLARGLHFAQASIRTAKARRAGPAGAAARRADAGPLGLNKARRGSQGAPRRLRSGTAPLVSPRVSRPRQFRPARRPTGRAERP